MPIIKSAIKRVRVAKRKTHKNRIIKNNTKETMKKFMDFLDTGKVAEAKALFPQVQKVCDTMAKKGLWHANKVARKISRLSRLIKTASTESQQKSTSVKKSVSKPKANKK